MIRKPGRLRADQPRTRPAYPNGPAAACGLVFADQTLEFDRLIADISRAFVKTTIDEIDFEITRSMQRVCLLLGLDRSTLAQIDPSNGWSAITHGWACDPDRVFPTSVDPNKTLPWHKRKMLAGELIIYSSLDEFPPEAAIDRDTLRPIGPKSAVVIPIRVGHTTFGAVAFDTMYEQRQWPSQLVQQLQFVADIFGHALERKWNVSEFLRLQNELAHVSRVATLGELTASLAHALNQPLAAILSNTEAVKLLLQSVKEDHNDVDLALDEIIENDRRASEVIKRFHALFKRGELKKTSAPPKELFEAVQRVIKSEAAIRRVSLNFECPSPLPGIIADTIHLQQVLLNLILNAFDAVSDLRDRQPEVRVCAAQPQAGFIHITVRDNGPGIQPEIMTKLFDAFFTTKANGMGMGLAVARSIVEAHGGRLWANNNPQGGAVFEFTIPAQTNPILQRGPSKVHDAKAEYQVQHRRKIAVIEDDASQRNSLVRLLASAGHQADAFASAIDFLASADFDGFSCIVSDLRMPGVDGLELQDILHRKSPCASIVLITADPDLPDTVKAIKEGAVDFLEKPVSRAVLLEAIDRAIQRSEKLKGESEEIAAIKNRYERLTPREREVFALVSAGLLNKQIAAELGTVEKTIKQHRGRVMEKMEAQSAAELVILAERLGVRPSDDFGNAKGHLKPA
jgi:FixJ family two-component response regulator/signal transduction histidine kinase